MPEMRMMATTGMLGYGYTEEAFRRGLSLEPDFIAADGGSMDPGPHYLGEAVPFVSRQAMKRDLALMLEAGVEHGVPVLIGSAGGSGSDPQVAFVREIAEEIAHEKGLSFRMALIHAEQPKDYLKSKQAEGRIRPLGPIADLTEDGIEDIHRVVGMMGVEPFQKALDDGAQVVIAGRATDASIYSAIPLMRGYDPGLVW
ncbi:MAG: acyclic terpene utilization AtuA family protein, partial [Pseudomonadota bacterium]